MFNLNLVSFLMIFIAVVFVVVWDEMEERWIYIHAAKLQVPRGADVERMAIFDKKNFVKKQEEEEEEKEVGFLIIRFFGLVGHLVVFFFL